MNNPIRHSEYNVIQSQVRTLDSPTAPRSTGENWLRSLVMMLVLTLPAFGQQASSVSYDALLDQFYGQLGEGKFGEALDGLYATNPWLSANRDQITQLKTQFTGLSDLLGNYVGHERVVVQPLGERFVYVWELAYFDREPLQFHFTFYKPKDSWQLFTIAYDEDADVSAKELARRRLE